LPEEGPDSRAGPGVSGGSGHTASDQCRGMARVPRRALRGGRQHSPDEDSPKEATASASNVLERDPTEDANNGETSGHLRSTRLQRANRNTTGSQSTNPASFVVDQGDVLPGATNKENQRVNSKPNEKKGRVKWSRDEMREVLLCHFYTYAHTGSVNLQQTYGMWRERNPEDRLELDANKLATQRRYILNNKVFTDVELDTIKNEASKLDETEDPTEEVALEDTENTIQEEEQQQALQTVIDKDLSVSEQKIKQCLTTYLNRKRLPKIKLYQKSRAVLEELNEALGSILESLPDVTISAINDLIYASALAAVRELNLSVENQNQTTAEPPWKRRIKKKVQDLRSDLSRLDSIKTSGIFPPKKKKLTLLCLKYKIEDQDQLLVAMETLKQKIQAAACRLRRHTRRTEWYTQNRDFAEDPSRFYRSINGEKVVCSKLPPKSGVQDFWKEIWEKDCGYNKKAQWVKRYRKERSKVPQMQNIEIKEEDIKETIKTVGNWKAPGTDEIQNFWLKQFPSAHKFLALAFNKILHSNQPIPEWMTRGRTTLIPKNSDTGNPKNYRPITCLSTTYKILTSIIAKKISKHLRDHHLFPTEQKGNIKDTLGCKEHLLTSKIIVDSCKRHQRNLAVTWIDFKKAFDTVPHDWILESLRINKVDPGTVEFLRRSMTMWETRLCIRGEKEQVEMGSSKIKRGIFQGDALSPLLFCIALFPISKELQRTQKGYQIDKSSEPISHLLYVDDLKIFAKDEAEMTSLVQTVRTISSDICMEFGNEKCASIVFKRGKLSDSENVQLYQETGIKCLEPGQNYKYLGVDEGDGIDNISMKSKIKDEYTRRVRQICKTQLNSKNRFNAISALAIPVVSYGFGIVDWRESEIQELDRTTRKILTKAGAHHPKSDVNRLYVPRSNGGRGLVSIEDSWKREMISLAHYIANKDDKYLQTVCNYEKREFNNKGILYWAEVLKQRVGLTTRPEDNQSLQKQMLCLKDNVKKAISNKHMVNWKQKELHGQHIRENEKEHVNFQLTQQWLTRGLLKVETEGFLIAAQDQALNTKYYRSHIIKSTNDDRCRVCRLYPETVQHLLSACPILAGREYVERHDNVCRELHHEILKTYHFRTEEKWYRHNPKAVYENDMATILWNMQIQTDRKLAHNKPDIVIKDKQNKNCYIIDVAIPSDFNLIKKEAEKELKYRDLQIEIERMWGIKAKVIPIVIGALGTVTKQFQTYLEKIPGNHSPFTLQKMRYWEQLTY